MTNLIPLDVQNLNVFFDDKPVLKDISFTAGKGEFIGIIGPNGAGKSTLLKAMRGLIPSTQGEVLFYNQPRQKLGDKELACIVAYMQQEINISFGFTALEIVLAGRYPYLGWWKGESKTDYDIARKYMEFAGISELENLPVQSMSGGQRQRVLLAKVLAQETPIIFLDEPTASLDLLYQEEIFNHCKNICEQGKTVLIVAHDLKLATKFCTRILLLADGEMIADGLPEEVVTAQNLEKTYGLHSAVFVNKVTGNLDIHTYAAATLSSGKQNKVHVIGGGGSGGGIMRLLYEQGYSLTAGVLQPSDTDAHIAEAFGIACIIGQPFSGIDESIGQENRMQIIQADWVVLANMCYGIQNIDNLQAAFAAKKLIIIEETLIDGRDYSNGQATRLYRELCDKPTTQVMTFDEFSQAILS